EMDGDAVEAVSDRRAGGAARLVVRSEHEMVDKELRAAAEQVGQRLAPLFRVEAIRLVESDPGQRLALAGDLVAAPRQLLLGLEQVEASLEPFIAGSGDVGRHCLSLHLSGVLS